MTHILVIEDDDMVRSNTVDLLTLEGYTVSCATNGEEGLAAARNAHPDLILCDIMMPILDGYGVLRQLRQDESIMTVPFIFLTARADRTDFRLGMELGADDYLTKPFSRQELLKAIDSRMAKRLAAEQQQRRQQEELRAGIIESLAHAEKMSIYDATIDAWLRALDLRDNETEGHTQRVAEVTVQLGRTMGLDEATLVRLRWGALLHDIGKIGIPDAILLKAGALTDSEWNIMRQHPSYANDMLSDIPFLHDVASIPYCHHERWDGKGYPRGLSGEDIPLEARIFAVVDVWDALRTNRPYRQALPEPAVREYIAAQAGKHFDPDVARIFLETMGAM